MCVGVCVDACIGMCPTVAEELAKDLAAVLRRRARLVVACRLRKADCARVKQRIDSRRSLNRQYHVDVGAQYIQSTVLVLNPFIGPFDVRPCRPQESHTHADDTHVRTPQGATGRRVYSQLRSEFEHTAPALAAPARKCAHHAERRGRLCCRKHARRKAMVWVDVRRG